jgi:CubicO group peptidase (beta-lactamase class C family)
MKSILITLLLGLAGVVGNSQPLYFPPTTGSAWDTLAPASLGYQPARIDSLYRYLDQSNTKAFVVLKDGKIVLEKYFDRFNKDSLWRWNSAGKVLTGMCIGIAQQEGRLSIYDTSSNIMGNGWTTEPLAKERLITVRNQLTMTSGIDDTRPGLDLDCTTPACLGYLTDAGTRWAYHNAVYTLLDSVLERATGQTLNAYLFNKVRRPTGMTGIFLPIDSKNIFFSNARSMARFGLLVLNKGTWNTTPVLTDTAYFRQMSTTSNPFNLSYGYLWWLNGKASYMSPQIRLVFPGAYAPAAPADMFAGLGKDGQIVAVVPSQRLVLIRMGEAPGTAQSGLVPISYVNDVWRYVNQLTVTGATPAQLPKPNLAPNPASGVVYLDILNPQGYVGDAMGKKVLTVNSHKLDVSGLARGLYTVHLRGMAPARLVVNY